MNTVSAVEQAPNAPSLTPQFETIDTGEPHAQRRRELLRRYPEIRSLFGYDPKTAWVTFGVVLVQFAIAGGIAWQRASGGVLGQWWVILIGSYALGAPLTHWLAMSIHETSHRLALRTANGNTALAIFANTPMLLPFAVSFNRYHIDHHTRLGVRGGDTDLPLAFEVTHIGNSTWRKAVWVFLHPLVYLMRGLTFARPPNRAELLNGVLILAADAIIYSSLGGAAIAYLAMSFYFALGLHPVAGHFIHEHYTFTKGQETFSYYGPLNAITFNVGFHNEHHDFMNIPGRRLPELERLVPDYRALASHSSWTGVLWRFITDRAMGYGSRIVRSREAFQKGRAALARAGLNAALTGLKMGRSQS
jgi:sphingolipid delta-4 desaturase